MTKMTVEQAKQVILDFIDPPMDREVRLLRIQLVRLVRMTDATRLDKMKNANLIDSPVVRELRELRQHLEKSLSVLDGKRARHLIKAVLL